MNRPKLPDALAEQIEEVYEDAGYSSQSEFARDAIRRRIEEVQATDSVPAAFLERNITDEDGLYLGQHSETNQPVTVSPDRHPSQNIGIVGDIGSGDRHMSKLLASRMLKRDDDMKIFIINPLDTYSEFAKNVDADVISLGNSVGINPFTQPPHSNSMMTDASEGQEIRFFNDVAEYQGRKLSPEECTLLQEIVRKMKRGDSDITPRDVLNKLHDILEEPNTFNLDRKSGIDMFDFAASALRKLRPLTHGGELQNLSMRTEIDSTNSQVQLYHTRNTTSAPEMHAVLNHVYAAAAEYDGPAQVVVDELQYFQNGKLIESLEQMVRQARHNDVGFTLIGNDKHIHNTLMKNAWMILYFRTEKPNGLDSLNDAEKDYIRELSTVQSGDANMLAKVTGFGTVPVMTTPETDTEREIVEER